MTDRVKVIKGLECLITNKVPCDGCPYYGSGYCLRIVAKDAMELLKEQEPIPVQTSYGIVRCGNCGKGLMLRDRKPNPEWKYCGYCGKRLKWDD